MRFTRLSSLMALSLVVTACSGPGNLFGSKKAPDNRPVIAASFYPIAEIVQRVAGDDVQLLQLNPAGKEPHETDLSAQQLVELSKADVVFYLGDGFQPSVEKAIKSLPTSVKAIDVLKSADVVRVSPFDDTNRFGNDPHVWLDPANMTKIAMAVSDSITSLLPNASALAQRLSDYSDELDSVGTLMDTRFASCERRELVTAHDAFGYFAQRAGLTTIAISGIDPSTEPSAKELEAIAKIARENNVATVFFEEILPKEFADTVAKAIGANTDSINAVETISQDDLDAGATYISIMKENITKVAAGLGCK